MTYRLPLPQIIQRRRNIRVNMSRSISEPESRCADPRMQVIYMSRRLCQTVVPYIGSFEYQVPQSK
jgi:hypothetical protein